MQMEIDDQPGLLTICLKGSFDELSADWLDVMGNRLASIPVDVLMDMSQVSYIDSRGLGAIFNLNNKVETLGFHIYFCNLSTQCREVFELAGLQHILRVYKSKAAARNAIELSKNKE